MLSPLAYKVIHLAGVFMILTGLAGLVIYHSIGANNPAWRKKAFITHGLGMILALVAGFGLLAPMDGFPLWAILKVLIWIALGAFVSLIKRKPEGTSLYWWGSIVLAIAAAYLALFKPFV